MDASEYRKLLEKYLEGRCSEAEKQLLDAWYDNLKTGPAPGDSPEMQEVLAERQWEQLLRKRSEPGRSKGKWYRLNQGVFSGRMLRNLTIAAAIALALGAGIRLVMNANHREVSGERQVAAKAAPSEPVAAGATWVTAASSDYSSMQVLADGSVVTLTPHSSIRYRMGNGNARREVELAGEAYFEVARDPARPFYVYANQVTTRVLGTGFLVTARGKDAEVRVAVAHGKVAVYSAAAPVSGTREAEPARVVLTSGRQLTSGKDGLLLESDVPAGNPLVPQERPRRITFENAPLGALVEALRQRYKVEIHFDATAYKGCTITTSMEDESLEEMLEVLNRLLNVSHTMAGNHLVLDGGGCR